MKLSLVVPSNRTPDRVLPLLKSLEAQRLRESDQSRFEIIWVVNGLPFHTCQELLGQIANPAFRTHVHLLYRPGASASEARNLGVEAAHGEVVLFLDDDLEFPSPFLLQKILDKVTAKQEKQPGEWAIGGSYLLGEASDEGRDYHHILQSFCRSASESGNVYLHAGFLAAPKSLLVRLGKLDTQRKWGASEFEINKKLSLSGIKAERVDGWNLLHHLEISGPEMVRKALKQGEAAAYFPEFKHAFLRCYYRQNWNTGRYMMAFQMGIDAPAGLRRLVFKQPRVVEIFLCGSYVMWKIANMIPAKGFLVQKSEKFLWRLLYLKNYGKRERVRQTEAEYHRLMRKTSRRLSWVLFFRSASQIHD